jgi:hypothetical protein
MSSIIELTIDTLGMIEAQFPSHVKFLRRPNQEIVVASCPELPEVRLAFLVAPSSLVADALSVKLCLETPPPITEEEILGKAAVLERLACGEISVEEARKIFANWK